MLDLNKSYRTTVNISDASNLILNHLGQNNSECVARMGDEVVINDDISEVTLISQIKLLLVTSISHKYYSIEINTNKSASRCIPHTAG